MMSPPPQSPLALLRRSPWFATLQPIIAQLDWSSWPSQADLAALTQQHQVCNRLGIPLRFADPSLEAPQADYETMTWLHGVVATRPNHWHDLFNLLCWLRWPQSKAALNALHWRALAHQVGKQRSPQRDAATLLDESGAILATCNPNLAAACRNQDWQTLFCDHRTAWGREITLLPIGHALLEKGLSPFIGIVAKTLLMPVSNAFFDTTLAEQSAQADAWCAALLDRDELQTTRSLAPLPVLGIPGWWPLQDEAFYADTRHFRAKRNCAYEENTGRCAR